MAKFSNNEIANAIYLGAKGKEGEKLSLFMQDVIKFLVQKKLFSKSEEIIRELEKVHDKENGVLKVNLSTKNKINDSFKKELIDILSKKYKVEKILLKENIDESIIDGFKLEIGDEILDTSLKNKLQKLQAHLTR